MKEYLINDLIDQYLLGIISPEDNRELQKLIAEDPEVASLVEESKMAYKALELERRKQLKSKLRALDGQAEDPGTKSSKWIGAVLLVLGVCLLYFYMSSIYFSPGAIAGRNYIAYKEYKTDHHVDNPQVVTWLQADDAFRNEDYQTAIQSFALLTESQDRSASMIAQWNILIAQLAIEGPGSHWQMGLDAFEKSAPEALAVKARNLRKYLNSWYYRFFSFRFQENFSTIKPRLI